jgi:hypothetical protein
MAIGRQTKFMDARPARQACGIHIQHCSNRLRKVVSSSGFRISTGGITQGGTEAEGLEMARDALRTMIWKQTRRSEDPPRPSKPRGRKDRMIRLPALQGPKAELYSAFPASGKRKADFARRLGIPETVDLLFDFGNRTRLDQMKRRWRCPESGWMSRCAMPPSLNRLARMEPGARQGRLRAKMKVWMLLR